MRKKHITRLAHLWIGLCCWMTWTASAQSQWISPSSWDTSVNDALQNPFVLDTLLIEGFDEREISLSKSITPTGTHDWFYPKVANIAGASDTKALRIYPGASVAIELDPTIFDQFSNSWEVLVNCAAQKVSRKDTLKSNVRFLYENEILPYDGTAILSPKSDNFSVSFESAKNKSNSRFYNTDRVRTIYILLSMIKGKNSSANGYYCFDDLRVIIKIPRYTLLKQAGEWNDPASWSHLFPQKGRNALVEGAVAVSTLASCSHLIMHQPDIQITGNGELTADSCTVVYPFAAKGKWSFVSFPFDVYKEGIDSRFTLGDASTITTNPHNNILYVMEYDSGKRAEQNGTAPCWRNLSIEEMQGEGPILQKGKGYLLAIDETADVQEVCFSSAANGAIHYTPTAKIVVNAADSQGENAAHNGWILCGNPYPSQLSLQDIASNADLDGNIYLYDGEKYQAYPIGSSYKLEPFAAFFVKAKQNTEIVVNQQPHSDDTLLRSSEISFDGVNHHPNVTANEFSTNNWSYRIMENGIELIGLPSTGQLKIFSITGKLMQCHALSGGSQTLSLPNERGIYLLRIEVGNKVEVLKCKR